MLVYDMIIVTIVHKVTQKLLNITEYVYIIYPIVTTLLLNICIKVYMCINIMYNCY